MLSIAIVDDQKGAAKKLESELSEVLKERKIDAKLVDFSSGKDFLPHVSEFECAFLDIDMPAMDGYELGEKIKEQNASCQIIMATGKVNDYKRAFKLRTLRFVTKPFVKEEIEDAVDAILLSSEMKGEIYANKNRQNYSIPLKKLLYIRAINSEVEIVTIDGIFRKEISLNELEKELDNIFFVRCHRQYIINITMTRFVGKRIYINEAEIPISRRRYKEVEAKNLDYYIKYK